METQAGKNRQAVDPRSPRQRVLLTGLVAYADLSISYRCTIRDRSDRGARLKLPIGMVVPPDFWLIDVPTGLAYEATAVWRHYPEVGVTLGTPTDLKFAEHELLHRRLRALWTAVIS